MKIFKFKSGLFVLRQPAKGVMNSRTYNWSTMVNLMIKRARWVCAYLFMVSLGISVMIPIPIELRRYS